MFCFSHTQKNSTQQDKKRKEQESNYIRVARWWRLRWKCLIKPMKHVEEAKQVGGEHINARALLPRPCVIVDCISHFAASNDNAGAQGQWWWNDLALILLSCRHVLTCICRSMLSHLCFFYSKYLVDARNSDKFVKLLWHHVFLSLPWRTHAVQKSVWSSPCLVISSINFISQLSTL